MRFFFRHLDADPDEMTPSSRMNWKACNDALQNCSSDDFLTLRAVYRHKEAPMQDIVRYVSEQCGVSTRRIWTLLHKYTRAYAKMRGLI